MSFIERRIHLASEPGSLGLNCTADGLSLAGAPLLRKSLSGFEPRPETEVRALLQAAYGGAVRSLSLGQDLDRIAQVLNRGDLGRAMIAALHLGWPDLDWEAGTRVARTNDALAKFDPDEPRDWHGRWTSGTATEAGSSASRPAAKPRPAAVPEARRHGRRGEAKRRDASPPAAPAPSRKNPPKPNPVSAETAALQALQARLRDQFDRQTPEQFADQVYRFSDWIGRNGAKLSPQDRQLARAEYEFLQGGLEFWIAYKAMPATTHGHLLSASSNLFSSAYDSGIVGTSGPDRGLPRSFLAAGFTAEAFGGASPIPKGRRAIEPLAEDIGVAIAEARRNRPGLGGVLNNEEVGIDWNGGIEQQGIPFEDRLARDFHNFERLEKGSKTWDFFTFDRRAISCKTLNTRLAGYAADPKRVFSTLKTYIDAAANYKARRGVFLDVEASEIRQKEIQLAIPEYTSDAQWKQINAAIDYANGRGVTLTVTRIR